MIKQFLTIYLLLFNIFIYAQVNPGATCAQAGCSTSGTYTSLTGTASIGGYSCLGSTPNANWLALGISTNGSIHLKLTQVANNGQPIDVDFALYGPFTSVANGCPILSNLNAVDCSFSGSNVEYVDIANAVAGQVYILLTTNFGGASGTITLAQSPILPSTGSINCNINFMATITSTGAACGFSNGVATAIPSGGFAPYSYLWNSPGNPTTPTISNLAPGIYSVTINSSPSPTTNQNFNPITVSVNIPAISATYNSTSTPAFCSTSATGSATATFNMQNGNSGITASYLWNDPLGQTTSTATGLLPGTYICSVTLSNGCTGTTSVTVGTQPAMQLTQSSNTPVSCFSGSNGSVAVTVTNGTAPYSYLWSNSATTSSLSNLAAGTYTVQVTDAKSCVKNGSFTIVQPTILDAAFSSISNFNGSNISCFNGSNGAATISASGGVVPYTYLWNNGSSLSNQTNLIAGNYTVTITDSKLCTLQKNVILTQPNELELSEIHQNISCYNGNNGSINLSVSGGTAPFTYLWSTNSGAQNLTNLIAGLYNVVVTDANGCTKSLSISLTQPTAPLSSTDTHTDILCKGFSTGAIDLSVTGGTTPYTYLWSNGQTTQDITSLLSGTYFVSITDAKSCVLYDTIQITEPLNSLSLTSIVTPINCFGDATGAINISPAGGTAPYTFTWSNASTSEDISALLTGNYQVTVTDFYLCVLISNSLNIPQPIAPLALSALIDTVNCFNGSDGAINLSVTGGTSPYTYSWTNGQTTQDIDSLISGNYTVIVTDANGCIKSLLITLTQPAAPLSSTDSHTDVLCKGFSTGAIDLSVTGGTTPYTYSWSNGQSSQDIASLLSGIYSVLISDFNGCVLYDTLQITEPLNSLSLTSIVTPINCYGDATGAINISPAGGTAPYTFAWTNASSSEDISALLTGNYQVTVTDAHLCVLTSNTLNIPQPLAPIVLTALIDTVNCFNGSDGAINLSVTGGSAPYTYSWSNGQTSQDIDSLISGNYTVIVSDVKGCSDTLTLNVSQPLAPINTSGIKVNVLCKGFSTGAIDLSLTGGTTPFSYLWSNGQTTQDIDSLLSGTYSVVISDFNGCFFYDTLQITEPLNSLSLTSIVTPINCYGDATGAINISPAGGTAPFTFAWTNASTLEDISALLTGNYQVTVTDAHLCVLTSNTLNIPQPLAPLALTAIVDAVKCNNGSDGAINLSVTGGTSPYTYLWSNGQTTQDIDSLILGNYEVILSDTKGCKDSVTYQVTQPIIPLTLSIAHTDAVCVGGTQGTIDLSVIGGTAPYSYLWNNLKTTPDLDSLYQGFYYVLVTDANGCNDTISATVLDPNNSMILSVVKTDVQCFAGSDGTVNLSVQFGTPGFAYDWNTGTTTQDLSNLPIGTYAVNVTDTNSCGAFISVVINQPATPVSGSISSIDVLCKAFATGSIDVSSGGGIAPYTYLWNNNQLTQDLQNLTAGIYTVTIKDSHNCVLILSDTIFEPAAIVSASENHLNVKCFSNNTGSINVTPTGGVGNYTFQWLSGETTEDIDSLIAGNYFVTIKDGNNCTFPVTIAITQPSAALSLATSITNVSCFNGSNGVINLTPSGGTIPYSYFWSDSTTNQDLVNYPIGTYSVIVTDTNNCIDSIAGTITQPTLLVISGSTTPVICHGDASGTATVVANGGTPGYSYLWSNGDQNALNDSILTGTYAVLVTDNLGCKDSLSLFVNEPTLLTSTTTHIDNPCYGNSVGSVSVVPAGGIAPYTYLWSNFATTATTSNLIAGVYTVVVKDSNNCSVNDTTEVIQPLAPLNIDFVTSDVLCFNGTSGAINATTSGGTTPYAFSWNTSATTEDLSNIPIGIYTLTVTDDHNCILAKTDTLIEPALLDTSNVILDDISCNGFSDGSINLTTVGGVIPYSFGWSNSTTNEDLTNVPIGTYTLTITDAHLCVSQFTYTLNQPLPLISTYTTIEPLCYAYSDGSITLNTTGGTTPYAYSWTNGSTSAVNSGIVTGNYTATITDAQNCVFVLPCFIDQPAQIQVSFNVSDTVGCDPTTIEFTNTSDEQFISIWQFGDGNSANGSNITNTYNSPGCFDVSLTVESPIGCTNSVSYPSIICINPTPTAGISANPTTLDTSNPETEILNTTTGAVSYEWNMGDNGLYNFFQPGMYTYPMYTLNEFLITLTATSDKGCVDTAQYTIFFDNSLIFYVPNTFTPDGNEYNNVFKPILTSLVAEYQMQIYNRWGELIFESLDKEIGWDGSYKGGIVQNGAYNWVIKIKTDGTQTHVKRGNVLLLR